MVILSCLLLERADGTRARLAPYFILKDLESETGDARASSAQAYCYLFPFYFSPAYQITLHSSISARRQVDAFTAPMGIVVCTNTMQCQQCTGSDDRTDTRSAHYSALFTKSALLTAESPTGRAPRSFARGKYRSRSSTPCACLIQQ